ncbi:MAG TPA: hypothetical protein PKE29_18880, partial [Phycisphaerales bacterium]|nr:hypothetical protein [Phycisphaerales bacterium]
AGGAVMVDLRDGGGARRMVMGVVREKAGGAQGEGVQTWFVKMTGSVKGAEAERAAFERFVRTVGLGEP